MGYFLRGEKIGGKAIKSGFYSSVHGLNYNKLAT